MEVLGGYPPKKIPFFPFVDKKGLLATLTQRKNAFLFSVYFLSKNFLILIKILQKSFQVFNKNLIKKNEGELNIKMKYEVFLSKEK